MDLIEEEASSSPPLPFGGFNGHNDIKEEIYARLLEDGNKEALSNPDFREQFLAHFNRLPGSYALDLSVDRAEDILLHQKILAEANDPDNRPVFHVRLLKLEDLNLDVRKDAEDIEEHRDALDASSIRLDPSFLPVHEITFSTLDKPKLLSQLSALLSDVGLNIREAHVFSTIDGFSLDVFVVDGWSGEDTAGLHKALAFAIARSEGSWSGSSHSASERNCCLHSKLGDMEIDMRLLKIGEKIGCGSCGDQYRGIYLGQDVAIKVLRYENLNESLGVEFNHEVNVLRRVQHENIVCFIGACTNPPQLCIVTEYMHGGSLYDFLHKHHNALPLPLLLKVAIDICKGMNYLHQNKIIHRDLKTANLLMDKNRVVKVADFGVARFQDQQGVMTAETGTYRWMAPEVINHLAYDEKADVFSFAVVLWELLTSKIPYNTMTPLQAALGVRQGLRPELPENAHPKLLDLMQRCWETVPAKRPSFANITAELEELLQQVQEAGEPARPVRRKTY